MTDIRTYVIDTSVLLSDPWARTRFAEHEVVVPLVVIRELEAKRHHQELGCFARQALRLFDDLRVEHGRLDSPFRLGRKGYASRRAQPHGPVGVARGFPERHQRFPDPGLRGEPRRRRQMSYVGLQGHSPSGEGLAVGLPADEYHAQTWWPRGRGMARWRPPPRSRRAFRRGPDRLAPRPGICPATPAIRLRGRQPDAMGRVTRASGSGWFVATARRSGCAAGPPSNGWRSIC